MNFNVNEKGSLGLLALGDYGIEVWNAIKNKTEVPAPQTLNKNLLKKEKTLIIGWDSADWSMIHKMISKGGMPTFERFLKGGSSGKIKTLEPSFSPMLWTSIATGKMADKHGILGFLEPNEESTGLRPIQSTSRKCHALWNILGSKGYKSNVVGWWPSHPAEPINGVMVSNQFGKIKRNKTEVIDASKTVYPEDLLDTLSQFKIQTKDLTEAHLLPFVPNASQVDQDKDNALSHLADHIAQLTNVQSATTYLMQNTDWDLTAVYFNDLDQICHKFGKYTGERPANIPEDLFNLYSGVVEGAYRFYDMLLNRLLQLAGDNTNVIILSDHGFKLGEQKLMSLPQIPASIALEHNQFGILAMKGPKIKSDASIFNASLLDITPTVLSLFGLPSAEDMDGEVLSSVLNVDKPQRIKSWEDEEGDFGTYDELLKSNPIEAKMAINQLVELGYIEQLEGDIEDQIESILNDTKYNLSKVYWERGNLKECVSILEDLLSQDMVDIRFNKDIILAYIHFGEFEKAYKTLSNFRKFDISKSIDFDHLEGKIKLREGKLEEAQQLILEAYSRNSKSSNILTDLGLISLKQKDYDKVVKWLNLAIKYHSQSVSTFLDLSKALYHLSRHDEAIDSLLTCLEMNPHHLAAHFHMGKNLLMLEAYQESATAFENCLLINPGLNRARNNRINIYKNHLEQPERLQFHLEELNHIKKDEIIIVSGLPRSGTSMVMQMMDQGGFKLLIDNQRESDESNPNGYFEYQPVKNTLSDSSWLSDATGKVVKVVSPLLKNLDLRYKFKIIWIDRKLSEVLLSQQEMLSKKDSSKKSTLNLGLESQYKKMIAASEKYLEKKNNVEVLKIKYQNVISSPLETANLIYDFLGDRGDVSKMASAVDQELHRVKVEIDEFGL